MHASVTTISGSPVAKVGDIVSAMARTERDKQWRIGPSGIGDPCDWCLTGAIRAHRHGTAPAAVDRWAWSRGMGTAVHAALERSAWTVGALPEVPLEDCGQWAGGVLSGTADLIMDGWVIDWKVLGAYSLRGLRANGISARYRVQAQAYGLGAANTGMDVRGVAVVVLPRSESTLDKAVVWAEAPDRSVVDRALVRASVLWERSLDESAPEPASDPGCFACRQRAPKHQPVTQVGAQAVGEWLSGR